MGGPRKEGRVSKRLEDGRCRLDAMNTQGVLRKLWLLEYLHRFPLLFSSDDLLLSSVSSGLPQLLYNNQSKFTEGPLHRQSAQEGHLCL